MIVSREARTGESGWMDIAVDLLARLAREFPVYLAEGNHEAQLAAPETEGRFLPAYRAYCGAADRAGVKRLHNIAAELPPSPRAALRTASRERRGNPATSASGRIRIYGLDLDCITYEKWKRYPLCVSEVEEKIGRADRSCFNIVMAHNPKYFPVYAEWGADLVLSGHIHGGILRFPNGQGLLSPDWTLLPPYTAGEYHEGESSMILTAGIGTHTAPIRINNPQDLCRISVNAYGTGI